MWKCVKKTEKRIHKNSYGHGSLEPQKAFECLQIYSQNFNQT